MKIVIDLLKYQPYLEVKKREGKVFLCDPFRGKEVVATPEELVRQLLLTYLVKEKHYKKNLIALEKGLRINELERRFDAVVFNTEMKAQILFECKAPSVKISEDVFHQIAQYNQALQADYLIVANGVDLYCCKMNYEEKSYSFLPKIPDIGEVS
jgi:hypothetical protein